jgi:small conductance mechanosensitive channel
MATNDANSVTEATNEVALATDFETVLEHDIGVLEKVLEEVIGWLIGLIPGSIIAVIVMSFGLFLMMIGARPFREGDLIEFGPPPQIGRVRDVALTCTVLDTPDNVRIVVPNATIWRNRIYNFSTHGVRAINIPVSVPHDVNIRWVEHIAMDVLKRHAAVLNKPEPSFSTTDVAADHIRAKITAWSHVSSMNVFSDVMKEMQKEFEVAELPVKVPSEDIDLKREE